MKKETKMKNPMGHENWMMPVLNMDESSETMYVSSQSSETRLMYDDVLRLTSEVTGQTFRVCKPTVSVGRSKEYCDLLLSSVYAARLHAFFYHENATWFLMDNGAMNGTFLNGERLASHKKYELVQNDKIRFADSETFCFEKTTDHVSYCEPKANAQVERVIGGKYVIEKLLSGGTSVSVYLAREQKTQTRWVVNAYSKSFYADDRVLDGVKRMYQKFALLKHPMLPMVAELLENEEYLYIVLKSLEGETLDQLISRDGPQSPQKVMQWGEKLCDVLGYLHGQSEPIIHMDVRPSNLLLMQDGTLRLLGLEGAYWTASHKAHGKNAVFGGTAGYAAPEQFGGVAGLDARTDIYGLGATLYSLVTGARPDLPPHEMIPIRQFNSKYPKQLEHIIRKATQRNPDNRYQSCDEMKRDLEKRSIWNKLLKR